MTPPRDPSTLDMFTDFTPRDPVTRFQPEAVRSASLRDSIARAVSATLEASDFDRDVIAKRISEWSGERVSRAMLDAYASQGRSSHNISFLRAIGLVVVTKDPRLYQLGAEAFGHVVVEDKWMNWVRAGQAAAAKIEMDKIYEAELRAARRGGR